MNPWLLLLISLFFIKAQSAPIDLQTMAQDFVLETKRIEIPGYPYAFNPSLVRWRGFFLLSFKVIPDPKNSFNSHIGLVWLDEHFNPIGEVQLLDTRKGMREIPSRSEDARLIVIQGRLFMIYSDCTEPAISKGGFRVHLGEIDFNGTSFSILRPESLKQFEGETQNRREKNWVPFEYNGGMLLSYQLAPHLVMRPRMGTGRCETVSLSQSLPSWDWGELRGGTPALLDGAEYLAIFHTSMNIASAYSDGKVLSHYFMGAYTFSAHPPFEITRISPEPIVGKGFYEGALYKPYWKPVCVVFPGGLLLEGKTVWVAYGRQDHEVWIAKLDKQKLLQSLVPVAK